MTQAKQVLPGEIIGAEEEFVAGQGTFVDSEGNIRASVQGCVDLTPEKAISVKPGVTIPRNLKKGDVVYGRVEEIFEPVALVNIQPIESRGIRQGPTEGYSVLHVSRIKKGYVESIRDEMKIGDIIKAVVEDFRATGEVLLRTSEPGLGVIKAYCSRCRAPLEVNDRGLKCSRCGSFERRHLSKDYLVVK